MSEKKIKSVPIRDFLFEGLRQSQRIYGSGAFPAKNTKVSFQMPRKVMSASRQSRRKNATCDTGTVLKDEIKLGWSYKETPKEPLEILKNLCWNVPKKKERYGTELKKPQNNTCPLNSIKVLKRERPKTSTISRRKIAVDDHYGSNPNFEGDYFEKKKAEKLDVFINVPSFVDRDDLFLDLLEDETRGVNKHL